MRTRKYLNRTRKRPHRNQKGQGLIEYLIIVSLMAIASIAVMKVLGQNIQGQFARVSNALRGDSSKPRLNPVQKSHYQQKDLSDFFNGATNEKD